MKKHANVFVGHGGRGSPARKNGRTRRFAPTGHVGADLRVCPVPNRVIGALFIVILFCVTAFAADLPRIAVYVTGDVSENERRALGTRMLAALVNSGRYIGIERGNAFIAEIEREHVRQRSGAVDDAQISALGRQFGVKYVCIADITPAFGEYQVSARIIDVETAVVMYIAESFSSLQTSRDLATVSDTIVNSMFPAAPVAVEPRKPEMMLSMGAGMLATHGAGGGVRSDNPAYRIKMPYNSAGAYLFFDAVYAKISVSYSIADGKWAGPSNPPNMPRTYASAGVFAKYPITNGLPANMILFPLAGIHYDRSFSATIEFTDRPNYPFDGEDDPLRVFGDKRHSADALSALWFKFGGGFDIIDLERNVFLRLEMLYGLRAANTFEKDFAESARAQLGHGLTLKVGAGIKF